MIADIVVGLQHGDEAKGKVTHHLCKDGDLMEAATPAIQYFIMVKSLLLIMFQLEFFMGLPA